MTNLNATLSHIQGNILITLDGADGAVAECTAIQPVLTAATGAGILPGNIQGYTGNRDTVMVVLAQPECGHAAPFDEVETAANAIKAVLNTAGIETALDNTFERAIRHDEHWIRFIETADEELSLAAR